MFDVALRLSEKASDAEMRVIFWTGNVTMDTFYSYSTSQNTENHKQTKKKCDEKRNKNGFFAQLFVPCVLCGLHAHAAAPFRSPIT